jgi:ankyrin repeat domain-containing protein 17
MIPLCLLAHGADVNKHNKHGRAALHAAASKGFVKCAAVLITAGADVTSTDSEGMTSLHDAVTGQHSAVAQLLLERGAAASLNSVVAAECTKGSEHCCAAGLTALMMCATADTVKVLLAAGADVHVTTAAGDTCLHMAVKHALAIPVLCVLLKAGADLHAVNNDGRTAAEVAHDCGSTLTEQLLHRAAQQG